MTTADDSRARRRTLFLALSALSMAGQAGAFLYIPALPEIAAEFGVGEAEVQATVVAFILGSLAGFSVYGPLSDRLGRAPMMIVATVLFVGGSVACALAGELGALTLARFVQGAGSITGIVTGRAVIRDAWPRSEAGRAMSHFTAVNTIAPAASPVAGALALTVVDWRSGFWLTGAVALVAMLFAIRALPARLPQPAASMRASLGRIVRSTLWRRGLLLNMTTNASFIIMMAGSPFVFMQLLGMNPISYSLVVAAILCGFAVAAIYSGELHARVGTRAVMRLALIPLLTGAVALSLVVVFAPSILALAVTLGLTIGAMGLIVPTVHTTMLAPFPDLSGTATSIAMLVTSAVAAAAVWFYAQTVAGSVAGFGLVISGLAALIAVWALRLPDAEPTA